MLRIIKIIFNNFWVKLVTLALAVSTWFYVFDLVNTDTSIQKRETAEQVFSRYKFIVKEVPVKPVFKDTPPKGYKVDFNKVEITPPKISILGPEEILSDIRELKTEKINLSRYKKNVTLKLAVDSDVKFLQAKDKTVAVFIPVEAVQGTEIESK